MTRRVGSLGLIFRSLGYYTLMAMVLNNAGLPLPGNAEPPLLSVDKDKSKDEQANKKRHERDPKPGRHLP